MKQKIQKIKAIPISPDAYRELRGARKQLNNRFSEGEIVEMLILQALPYYMERLDAGRKEIHGTNERS